MQGNIGSMDEQFGLNPQADPVEAPHPVRKRCQAAAMVGQPAELALDVFTKAVEGLPELPSQQVDTSQAAGTMATMPKRRPRTFALSHQLVADRQGDVMQGVTVIRTVTEDVASAPFQGGDHPGGNLRFGDVQGGRFPTQRDAVLAVKSVELVAFRPAASHMAPLGVGIFAVAAHKERLAVHRQDPFAISWGFRHPLFHLLEQPLDFRGAETTADGGLRWQLSLPQALRPIGRITSPTSRSVVDHRPEVHPHDLAVEKTLSLPTTVLDRSRRQVCTIPTRVRVPWLVSCFLETINKHVRGLAYFSSPPRPFAPLLAAA